MFDVFHIAFYILASSWIMMVWVVVGAFKIIHKQQAIIKAYEDMFKL